MEKNAVSLHSSVVHHANLRTHIEIAKREGFDCIEPLKQQVCSFLQAGYTPGDVKKLLGKLEISAVSWLGDIERQGHDYIELMEEAEELFAMAHSVGSKAVEIINGPLDWHAVEHFRRRSPYSGYMGLQGLPGKEQEALLAKNLTALAELAEQYSLILYFEPLCWTPIPSLKAAIPIVQRVGHSNLKIVVDFYHNYMSGMDTDFISQIDPALIYGVHICNARKCDGKIPCEEVYRDAAFHQGAIPIRQWVDAVKATGFDGWWAYETFSRQEQEETSDALAHYVREELRKLIGR